MADPESVSDQYMLTELEKQKQASARLMDSLAAKLGAFASQGSRRARRAAQYVQRNSVREMATGLERAVRRRPASSMIIAAVAGFVLGRALRPR